ncbi:hypothetical protein NA56DRAFT_666093 [Hyaloscypha hepaticicola]|uniref:Uncharacterized protein n=1 Tax=Hyaloscypha hepaticicola TaxID=2082293 RepID=A0A2J6PFL6_9HELO|nr:hypothetical protein NA56DRAFT_666093 [Hyaloscypha hepaticicola]
MDFYAIPVVVVGTPDTATNVMLSYAKRATKRKPKRLLPRGSTHPDKTWPIILPSHAIMGQTQRLYLEDPKGEHWLAGSTLSQVGSLEKLEKTKSISKEVIGWRYMDSKTIATAGHVLYDGVNGRGIAIEAHIGYRGANSDLIGTHDSKMATFVAVHREWYNHFAKENDIPLTKLQTAFDEVLPLRFKDSPEKEERIKLCMAGYPEDIPTSSRGQFIRESKREIDFHLQSNNGMLHHQLDTFKGNSGSPVFQIGEGRELEVIAIHTQSCKIRRPDSDHKNSHMTGRFYRVNQAVPLGHQGNILATIEQATTILITRGDYESINIRTDYICYRCVYCVTTKVQPPLYHKREEVEQTQPLLL